MATVFTKNNSGIPCVIQISVIKFHVVVSLPCQVTGPLVQGEEVNVDAEL